MRFRVLLSACVVLSIVAIPTQAAAQDARTNIAASYTVLNDREIDETFPVGWLFAVTRKVSPTLGLVGEMGGNYKRLEDDTSLKVHAFLAGVRLMGSGSTSPFAQVLAGVGTSSVKLPEFDESDQVNGFVVQPGVGVDVRMGPRAGLRLQADYRLVRADGDTSKEFRFGAGIVIGVGR